MRCFEISWFGPHFGEEPPITGRNGSGTIFFCRCNLKCVYCQNWQISQERISCRTVSEVALLRTMLTLQKQGTHNINLVSPTVWASRLRDVIRLAKEKGLIIPVLWNTNAYETVKSLQKLEGLVDIYLPDCKYAEDSLAVKYSNCPGYSGLAKKAILEMQRQVGDLAVDKSGVAKKGLIVRHLVLPGYLKNTKKCLKFIRSISDNIHLSLMSQYNPAYRANLFPEINRTLTKEEYEEVLSEVKNLDFKRGWIQEFGGVARCLNPDFSKDNPFS